MAARHSDKIYAELRRRIMSGRYEAGAHLREEHVAQEFGVSRTPVRAAMQRLDADQLVTIASRGAIVARWTDWDVAEIFDLRMLLEPFAASMAAKRASEADIARMDALNAEMLSLVKAKGEPQLQRIEAINNAFHHLVLEAAGSGRLKGLASSFVDTPVMIGSFYFYSPAELAESAQHHMVIVDAIRRRDAEFATRAMEYHLKVSAARFEKQRVSRKADDHPAST